jgi:hypothetical protein
VDEYRWLSNCFPGKPENRSAMSIRTGSRQGKKCLSLCEAIKAFSEIAIERQTLVNNQSYWVYSYSESAHINTIPSFSPIANSCDENRKHNLHAILLSLALTGFSAFG